MGLFKSVRNWFSSLCDRLEGKENDSLYPITTFNSVKEMLESLKFPKDPTEELKAKGWKVKIRHLRYFDFLSEDLDCPVYMTRYQFFETVKEAEINNEYFPCSYSLEVCPFGGKTECTLISPEGKEYKGESRCSLKDKDNFSRRIGRAYAVSRAYETYLKEE